jgi:hypothetical protein
LGGNTSGMYLAGTNKLGFSTAGTFAAVIDASGNVGIGTASPAYKVSIVGASQTATTLQFLYSGVQACQIGVTSDNALFFGSDGSTGATERMRIASSGNVGIGTASPSSKLAVTSAINDGISVTDGTVRTIMYSSTGGIGTIGTTTNHPLQIFTNNSLKMYIGASGNIGIGTSAGTYQLQLFGTGQETANLTDAGLKGGSLYLQAGAVGAGSGGAVLFGTNAGNSTAFAAIKGYLLNGTTNTVGALCFSTRYLVGDTSLTERMRIDYNGSVGIGTDTPATQLDVKGLISNRGGASPTVGFTQLSTSDATHTGYLEFYRSDLSRTGYIGYGGATTLNFIAETATTELLFGTNSNEKMRLDINGNLNIGSSSNITGNSRLSVVNTNSAEWVLALQVGNTTNGVLITNVSGTAGYSAMIFYNNGTSYSTCGSISVTGSSTSFNTSSDYRMKENINTLTTGLATIGALKPVTYDWISTQEKGEGFIAHELAEVIPLAVFGEKDAVDKDGKIQPQGVDYSKIVVHLVAAIQELSAKVAALEGK